jgi:hypothetical protein
VELAHHAKLKGCVKTLSSPLDALAGIILEKFVPLAPPLTPNVWTPLFIQQLRNEIDCVWQIQLLKKVSGCFVIFDCSHCNKIRE